MHSHRHQGQGWRAGDRPRTPAHLSVVLEVFVGPPQLLHHNRIWKARNELSRWPPSRTLQGVRTIGHQDRFTHLAKLGCAHRQNGAVHHQGMGRVEAEPEHTCPHITWGEAEHLDASPLVPPSQNTHLPTSRQSIRAPGSLCAASTWPTQMGTRLETTGSRLATTLPLPFLGQVGNIQRHFYLPKVGTQSCQAPALLHR